MDNKKYDDEYIILYDLIESFLNEDINKQNYDQIYEDLKIKHKNLKRKKLN